MSQVARSKPTTSPKSKSRSDSSVATLTADDVRASGRAIRSVKVSNLFGDGEARIVHYRPIAARLAIEFQEAQEAAVQSELIRMVVTRLGSMLTTESGDQLLTEDELLEFPVDVLMNIFNAITSAIVESRGGSQGNGSSGGEVATSSD